MTACFGGRQLVYTDLKKTQAALCFGVCIVFADVFKKGGNDGSAGSLAGFHHHEWDEMRVREEVTVRGPQVVGSHRPLWTSAGPACSFGLETWRTWRLDPQGPLGGGDQSQCEDMEIQTSLGVERTPRHATARS